MRTEDLSLVFMKGSEVEEPMIDHYRKVFAHWEMIWTETFRELDGLMSLPSDQFTRQDEIMALFYQGHCISVCCHRLANMNLPTFQKDSYFQAWTPEAISKLQRDGKNVIIDSQISVDPGFRKLQSGLRIIELMTCLSLRHLAPLGVSSITAAARNMRSMNQIFEKFSPETLEATVFVHGEETSLYGFYPSQIQFEKSEKSLIDLADSLLHGAFRSRLIHPFFQPAKGVSLVKKSA